MISNCCCFFFCIEVDVSLKKKLIKVEVLNELFLVDFLMNEFVEVICFYDFFLRYLYYNYKEYIF